MSFYADRGYRAVPDAVHRHEVEASGRDHSQSYSIPRKPVPSQSSYSYRLATDDGNIYAEQVSDTDRCRDRELQPSFDSQAANGLGISQDSPRADSAQSLALWSGVRGAHLESQRDSLLPQASAPARHRHSPESGLQLGSKYPEMVILATSNLHLFGIGRNSWCPHMVFHSSHRTW